MLNLSDRDSYATFTSSLLAKDLVYSVNATGYDPGDYGGPQVNMG